MATRSRHWPWPIALAAALALHGCITVGTDFSKAAVDQIRVGTTTLAEVRSLLGNPIRVGVEDGKLTWTYLRYRASLAGSFEGHDLVLRFDAQDRVSTINYSATGGAGPTQR
jgi:outer membrane protein assembly factor BamE (lipoprotein component of BamABCDE complex)